MLILNTYFEGMEELLDDLRHVETREEARKVLRSINLFTIDELEKN